jgi:four helix bundle protein
MELQTQLIIARKLNFVDVSSFETVESLASEVGRMLSAMLSNLRAAPKL